MNKDQVASMLRLLFAAGSPLAVLICTKLGVTDADYNLYYAVLIGVAPGAVVAIFAWWRNKESTQVAKAAALPSVAKIVTKDAANGAVGEMAVSAAHPNIVTESQNVADVKKG